MTEQTKAEAGAKLAEAIRESAYIASSPFLKRVLADYDAATKPRTITVNGVEVPEPVREALDRSASYYVVDPTHDCLCRGMEWRDDSSDALWLKRGLIHLTREAAESHARALIGASEKEQQA